MNTITLNIRCEHGIDWPDRLGLHHPTCEGGNKLTLPMDRLGCGSFSPSGQECVLLPNHEVHSAGHESAEFDGLIVSWGRTGTTWWEKLSREGEVARRSRSEMRREADGSGERP